MPDLDDARIEREGSSRPLVVFQSISPVAARLAVRLAEAGYPVLSQPESGAWQAEFAAGGGRPYPEERGTPGPSWLIECREYADLHPETLSSVSGGGSAYGRPRVEWMSAARQRETRPERPIATLTIAASGLPNASLNVDLHVSSRRPRLLVHGPRTLFEEALPLLTALADRVLYAGPST